MHTYWWEIYHSVISSVDEGPITISFAHHHRVRSADPCCCSRSSLYGINGKELSVMHAHNVCRAIAAPPLALIRCSCHKYRWKNRRKDGFRCIMLFIFSYNAQTLVHLDSSSASGRQSGRIPVGSATFMREKTVKKKKEREKKAYMKKLKDIWKTWFLPPYRYKCMQII